MIQAQELRIGNWIELVNLDDGARMYQQVNVYEIKRALGAIQGSAYEQQPIPLDAALLQKAGFKQDKEGKYWNHALGVMYLTESLIYENFYFEAEGIVICKPFKHLHQLQNLYFSLTGEELTINL